MSTVEVLVRNLAALAEAHDSSQSEIARRAGISQKSVNNLFRCRELGISPGIDIIEKVAATFGLSAAELISPNLTKESSEPTSIPVRVSRSVGRLIEDFLVTDDAGRAQILTIAEREAERTRGG